MGRDSEILVGLYLGTSKVSVVVAERSATGDGEAQILGIGQAPSRGIRKGMIVNLEQAVGAVRAAVADAEAIVGFDITGATVAFSGVDAQTERLWGMISVDRTARQMNEDDVERVIESALAGLVVPSNRSVIHMVPIKYSIDGNSGIDDPLGMTGIRLEVELQVVIVPTAVVQNVINCVERAGVRVMGLVFKPLAAALGSISHEERNAGVVSLSIGGGTTGVAVFCEGRPVGFTVIPMGGDHITNDLSCVSQIPFSVAEEVKRKISLDPSENQETKISVENRGRIQELDGTEVRQVIACRVEELLEDYVKPFIMEHSKYQYPSGVVLTGGVSRTPGIEAFASACLGLPVRIAPIPQIQKLQPGRDSSQYSLLTGIVLYLLERERNQFLYLDMPVDSLRGNAAGATLSRRSQRNGSGGYVSMPGESLFSRVLTTIKELF